MGKLFGRDGAVYVRALAVATMFVLVACGGGADDFNGVGAGDTQGDAPSMSDTALVPQDTGPGFDLWKPPADDADAAEPEDTGSGTPDTGEPLVPCIDNEDCDSGFCVPSAHGPVCTRMCVTECPPGWACRAVETNPDTIYLCVDLTLVLCRPCVDSGDCSEPRAGLDGYCVPGGQDGAFCGLPCNDGDDCAPGYVCEESETTEGAQRKVCVRAEGECECTEFSTQHAAWTECYRQNEYGVCRGERNCRADGLTECSAAEPGPEAMDGVDNDCDGETDEDGCPGDRDCDGVPDDEDCAPTDAEVGRCDDGNPCTDDICNAEFGTCGFPPREGACDDGDACTEGDFCASGACVPARMVNVNDGDPCTEDGCDPASGPWHTPLDDVPCDDGDECTSGERCYAGICTGGARLDCDDGDPCTDDVCVPELAEGCHHTPNSGGACDDGDPCTVNDTCIEGFCLPGMLRDCDDGNRCTTDSCDRGSGQCLHAAVENGLRCDDDADRCDGDAHCSEGVCVADTPPVTCGLASGPCREMRCDPATGGCIEEAAAEGTVCNDDGDPCNGASHCAAGACVQDVPPVVCPDDGNPCTEEYCDGSGGCATRIVTGCCASDGDCPGGVCVAGQCALCRPGDVCCTAEGRFVAYGQNGSGCDGECVLCNGGGSCVPKPNNTNCSGGQCWDGVCQQCVPGTQCCTALGNYTPYGQPGTSCNGPCQACNGAGSCGAATDGTACATGVCVSGYCRQCAPGSECCSASGTFTPYGAGGTDCWGACEQCDGGGNCAAKPWHTACGSNQWCEGRDCVDQCSDDCSYNGQTRCSGGRMETCGDWDSDPCREWGDAEWCDYGCDGDRCAEAVCSPGEKQCSSGDLRVCRWDGSGWDTEQCACGCSGSGSSAACVAAVCSPGERRCSGLTVEACDWEGCGWDTVETCPCTCSGGVCGALTGEVIVDSHDAGFTREGSGWWSAHDHTDGSADGMFNTGAYDQDMRYNITGGSSGTGTWRTTQSLCGRYRVYAHQVNPDVYDPDMNSSVQPNLWYDCTSVTYRVKHDGNTGGQSVVKSQATAGWLLLGTFDFTDRKGEVFMNDTASPYQCAVAFDAIKWDPQ